ncbi:ABC transporter substrate-binding protein [Desulfovibrio aminophilus]|nr:ABC transporter substrate-binding protein [Desulfovibrio aminophilus]MCM0756499.1 ABC transporter substrate-binding protein [Desulfovibrio aminophilus]
MSCAVHLALPPNVARSVRSRIAERFPDARVGAPDIHQEMYEFAAKCGASPFAGFAVSAYPQLVRNVLRDRPSFAVPEVDAPELRPELRALGLTPPAPELRIVAVAPCVLAVNERWAATVSDWGHLVGRDFSDSLGTPPRDTPLPFLAEELLAGFDAPPVRLDTASTPLDINRRVSSGELGAGLLIPAFGRTFRGGRARMVWPDSGALAVPLVACIGREAPRRAHDILEYLLSREVQAFLSSCGGVVPVRQDVPGFAELEESGWKMRWPGWDALLRAAEVMDGAMGAAPGAGRCSCCNA